MSLTIPWRNVLDKRYSIIFKRLFFNRVWRKISRRNSVKSLLLDNLYLTIFALFLFGEIILNFLGCFNNFMEHFHDDSCVCGHIRILSAIKGFIYLFHIRTFEISHWFVIVNLLQLSDYLLISARIDSCRDDSPIQIPEHRLLYNIYFVVHLTEIVLHKLYPFLIVLLAVFLKVIPYILNILVLALNYVELRAAMSIVVSFGRMAARLTAQFAWSDHNLDLCWSFKLRININSIASIDYIFNKQKLTIVLSLWFKI